MSYYIIVYRNTHDAMEAEKKLNEKGYAFRIMPTPTSITQSCGICTRFQNKENIEEILKSDLIVFKNIYAKNSDGFKIIK